MIPVNTIPTNIPVKRLVVKISKIRRSLAPATFSMESLIRSMPNRKSPRPPAKDKIIPTFIRLFPSLVSTSKNKYDSILRDKCQTDNMLFTDILPDFYIFYIYFTHNVLLYMPCQLQCPSVPGLSRLPHPGISAPVCERKEVPLLSLLHRYPHQNHIDRFPHRSDQHP